MLGLGYENLDLSFEEVFGKEKIEIIKDTAGAAASLDRIVENAKIVKVLGLDCEWTTKDKKRNPVALLQISCATHSGGLCVLLRLCKSKDLQTMPKLRQLLNDKSVLKFGVGILGDATKLREDYNLTVRGCVDLRLFAQRCLPPPQAQQVGSLSKLCKNVLYYNLDKSVHISCSDWDSECLTQEQVTYAAKDACVGREIFYQLLKLKSPNAVSGHYEVDWDTVNGLFKGLVDVKTSRKTLNSVGFNGKPIQNTHNLNSARKSPLYENCKVFSPDGSLYRTCDKNTALFYCSKFSGELLSQDPIEVQLKDEPPRQNRIDEVELYTEEKVNKCALCKSEDSLRRKYVVPQEYRRLFPEELKVHRAHDILLLCADCHRTSEEHDKSLRQDLVKSYKIPTHSPTYQRTKKAKSAAVALRNDINEHNEHCKLPDSKKNELRMVVADYCRVAVDDVNEELLRNVSRIKNKTPSEETHGSLVMREVSKEKDGYEKFENMWRHHFWGNMKPPSKPRSFSVDNTRNK